ncbi:MAG: RNA polymerase sporulation sigma factor SigH [Actinobacteria bacterium]|nr:RNA polymerase sporulation sigma factor SigH [Actinomycetota bacterium]
MYNNLTDDQIVKLAQKGDEHAQVFLINKYEYLVHFKAKSYFLHGADHDDTIQEGMIGLYKAIRDYRESKLCSFRSFALLCITRQIITAVKTATRKKHTPLNSYASLNANAFDEETNNTLLDITTNSRVEDPQDLFIVEEEIDRIKKTMKDALSELEWNVLLAYIDGKSYQEIADQLDKHTKVIDNALYRVKLKLKELR